MIFRTYNKIYTIGHEENQDLLKNPEEEIIIEEKLDGANFRFYINPFGQVIFGSHTQELGENKEHKYAKNFARCIEYLKEKLYQKDLEKYKGMVFYGECCVPHSMNYDWEKIPPFLGFDINNDENENYPKRYIPYPLVEEIYKELGLEFVPVVKVCKVKEIVKIDDELVPVSKYAIASGTEDTRKSEGIVLKKYSFIEGSKDEGDEQIFGKYVRDKFKETNALVFGDKRVKYNSEDDTGELIFKYCTNARIDKMIFKLLDEGEKLGMELMHLLPKKVIEDIFDEHASEIYHSNYKVDFKLFRRKVPERCAMVLKQVMANNAIQKWVIEK